MTISVITKLCTGMAITMLAFSSTIHAACGAACACNPCTCNPCNCDRCPDAAGHSATSEDSAPHGQYVTDNQFATNSVEFLNASQDCCPKDNCCSGEWLFDAEVLFWKACESGLTFGSETEVFSTGPEGGPGELRSFHNKVKTPHHKWSTGYRLGLGYRFPRNCWTAAFCWTHFDTSGRGHSHDEATESRWFTPAWGGIAVDAASGVPSPAGNGILLGGPNPPIGIGATGFPVHEASGHWKLHVNFADLEIGKDICLGSCMTLIPFIGVRGACINQKFDISYVADTVLNGILNGTTENQPIDEIALKSDFRGAGPRAGLNVEYNLGCGISLFGGAAASLLYGQRDIKSEEFFVVTTDIDSNIFELFQKDKDCGCRAITDVALGIRAKYSCCGKEILLSIGYENHYVFSENDFEKFTNFNGTSNAATDINPQNKRGDLSLQGVVFSARVGF